MRIAIAINTSWNIYNFRLCLVEEFLNQGHEVHCIAPEDEYSPRLVELGCKFHPVVMNNKGTNPIEDLKLIAQLKSIYQKIRPDVVLQYTIKMNVYGTLGAKLVGVPVINNVSGLGTTFLSGSLLNKVARFLYKFSFKYAAWVFFQNNDDRDLFVEGGLIKPEKSSVLPGSGINLDKFSPSIDAEEYDYDFLMVGRLLNDKGVREFKEASLLTKKEFPETKIAIVGGIESKGGLGPDQLTVDSWEDEGAFQYLGKVDSVQDLVKKSRCIVLPSYREGTPRSILEALAMGKPVIVTNVPGCKETLIENYNGYFCESRNAESLHQAFIKFLGSSQDDVNKMGLNSRLLAEEKFDEQIVVKEYLYRIENTLYGS